MRVFMIWVCLAVLLPLQLHAGIEFKFTKVDVKGSPGDAKLIAEFPFTITGDKPVKITRVKTSCGCTTAKLPKKLFLPGESSIITTTLKIGDRMGVYNKVIQVKTDDPEHAKTNLVMRSYIRETVDMSRSILIWKQGTAATTKTVDIEVIADKPLDLIAAKSPSAGFQTELKTLTPGGKYQVLVTPESTAKKLRAKIILHANTPAAHPQTFRIRALIK